MGDATTKLMHAAAEVVGGEDKLAERLGIGPALMRAYMDARLPLPDNLFERAVDLMLSSLENARCGRQPAAQPLQENKRD
jgi:hypothetical protein